MLTAVSTKTVACLTMLSGTGTVLADAIPLPDGYASMPATAILGLITLAAIAALVFKMQQEAKLQVASIQATAELTAAIRENNATNHDVARALMTKPCMLLDQRGPAK